MVHLRIHLAVSLGSTWAAPVVTLVDAMKHEYVQNISSNGGPAASLENAIDDGLIVGLNGHLRVLFQKNWRCKIKWRKGCTWRFTWFKYEHVSSVESAPDRLSEDTTTFEVKIKGAL